MSPAPSRSPDRGAGARDPLPGAPEAGLRWWSDGDAAILRRRSGRGFAYRDPAGQPVRDRPTLARIRTLAIPPAWTDVRICPDGRGHIQATGRDAKGRKQYRYHPRWRATRDEAKFRRLIAFGEALPRIRGQVDADLARPGLPQAKVLALVVRLLELTLARVGNEEYARVNRSFGLTTLRNPHARVRGSEVRLRFRGKSGRVHEIGLRDRRLAGLVRRCQELPGRELFAYVDDDGTVRDVRSEDVNEYLRDAAGLDVTAKMFRTWAATVLAARVLRSAVPAERGRRVTTHAVGEAMQVVSQRLGNTPAVARRSYVHPAVLEAFLDGSLGGALIEAAVDEDALGDLRWTPDDETATLDLLRRRAASEADRPARRRGSSGAKSGRRR